MKLSITENNSNPLQTPTCKQFLHVHRNFKITHHCNLNNIKPIYFEGINHDAFRR